MEKYGITAIDLRVYCVVILQIKEYYSLIARLYCQ